MHSVTGFGCGHMYVLRARCNKMGKSEGDFTLKNPSEIFVLLVVYMLGKVTIFKIPSVVLVDNQA